MGLAFDAVAANNDEMAIGTMQSAGRSVKDVVVGGIDATPDGLAAMAAGDLDVTVFQDAKGQGAGAVDAAVRPARGETVEKSIRGPFELVTPADMKDHRGRNRQARTPERARFPARRHCDPLRRRNATC